MQRLRFFLLLIFAPYLMAATPVIFQQVQLTIIAFGPAPESKAELAISNGKPLVPRIFKLKAQMRPSAALQQQDLFSIDPFARAQGHLFVFDPPALTGFQAPYITRPVDLIAIDERGTIQEIVPRAVPASLDPSQYAVDAPIKALLLLPAGMVDANGLKPGDRVQHAIFSIMPEKRK